MRFLFNFNSLTQNNNTMKNDLFFSQDFLRDMIERLQNLLDNPQQFLLTMDKDEILHEGEVSKMFGLTIRILRNHRNEKNLRAVKLGGRVFYLRTVLFLDILVLLYNDSK